MNKMADAPVPTIVIAGAGRFDALHARVWREAGARIVGICDVDPDRQERVAREFDVEHASTDLGTLLDAADPDIVVVASDEASHVTLAATALDAGCHVFVEKPLALSSEEAWGIHSKAESPCASG